MKKWYQFYAEHTNFEKLQQLVGVFAQGLSDSQDKKLQQMGTAVSEDHIKLHGEMPFLPIFSYIPWGHHIVIITKCKTIEEAVFYLCKTIEEGWSRKALDDCIRSDLYHTSGQAVTNFQERLPLPQGKLALELTKGNYDLGFLSLPKGYDEKELICGTAKRNRSCWKDEKNRLAVLPIYSRERKSNISLNTFTVIERTNFMKMNARYP